MRGALKLLTNNERKGKKLKRSDKISIKNKMERMNGYETIKAFTKLNLESKNGSLKKKIKKNTKCED